MKKYECYDGTPFTNSHWINLRDEPPLLGVDFHHTISTRCGACNGYNTGELSAGDPQVGVAEALKVLSQHFEIVIHTGYGKNYSPNSGKEIEDYLNEHGIPYYKVDTTKPSFMFNIDDRGIHHLSWRKTVEEVFNRMEMKRGYGRW